VTVEHQLSWSTCGNYIYRIESMSGRVMKLKDDGLSWEASS
jgi:hypothetical protein